MSRHRKSPDCQELSVRSLFRLSLLPALACIATLPALPALPRQAADYVRLTVHVDQPGAKISPLLYGLMTEEINYSYDGGLYAELVRNRSFKEDAKDPVHWQLVQEHGGTGSMALAPSEPFNDAIATSL